MTDNTGRVIDYLRISVTDKCNLRCRYCMPPEGVTSLRHEDILSFEEITRVCKIMARLGIKKVRITGGEPLVRKDICRLIEGLHAIPGIEEIAMTTNATLLAPLAGELKRAGLDRVNISLDALDPLVFAAITGRDALGEVKEGLSAALSVGFGVKINCVPCRELNEGELRRVAAIAQNQPVDVRFIELMPIGCGKQFHGISSGELLKDFSAFFGEPREAPASPGGGPACYYRFPGFQGRIGFISPISHKFCKSCNRVRLTAEGRFKLCLHYESGIDLRKYLRDGRTEDAQIEEAILEAVKNKPAAHHFESPGEEMHSEREAVEERNMNQIGG